MYRKPNVSIFICAEIEPRSMGLEDVPVFFSVIVSILIITGIPLISTAAPAPLSPSVNEDSNLSSPHYIITGISVPSEKTPVSPGNSITLNCRVRNTGANDTGTEPIQISATLGPYPLISRAGMISPMKSREEHHTTLTYLIPEGIPPRKYPLKISIRYDKEPSVNPSNWSEMKGPDILVVKKTDTGVKSSGCGCT